MSESSITPQTVTAAIYARKSVLTEKGESIENQVRRGIAYCEARGWNYIVYDKDEGYSGKNTDRPDFERMMADAEKGKFQYIISYKLDRISRSVLDFSDFIEKLNQLGIGYISITENFDTSTPVGRAMMMIIAVFAQLERETIAERVRDNMIDRAKLGKWNGGPVPMGFDVEKKEFFVDGKKKKASKLVINPHESEIIMQFYLWYYYDPNSSIRRNVVRANKMGILTKRGGRWNDNQMARILQNPIYCIADEEAYEYFLKEGVTIVSRKEEFDGKHGLILYNRRRPYKKTTRERDKSEWILAVGEHEGFIPSKIYIGVQNKLKENSLKAPRTGQGIKSVLSGLVKCGICKRTMVLSYSKRHKNDDDYTYAYFRCSTKEKQGIDCGNKNIRADVIEDAVIEELKKLSLDREYIYERIKELIKSNDSKKPTLLKEKKRIEEQINGIEKQIDNLINLASTGALPAELIKQKYESYEKEKSELIQNYNNIDIELNRIESENIEADFIYSRLRDFAELYDDLSFEEKKSLIQSLVKEVIYTNNEVDIKLYLLPIYKDSQDISGTKNSAICYRTDMGS
ncbi:Recombinase [Caldanaerobius fijiensis DSM 17918]|uniref:Recombinase n=1 Tax=Caldanaerobius fijiensis DSM 17918 TaxID=1121256 RepID=A0A1M5EML1_9THEO|nr:recombinase family protein [Caldanaerobius fijiensis]SHF80416.1 Recombinase [Caldanaerobius fijiensis DSM 17918]